MSIGLARIATVLKYWKWGVAALAVAAFVTATHLARSRGRELDATRAALKQQTATLTAQIKTLEQERENDRERQGFRRVQEKTIHHGGDAGLRDAYQRLRARQAERGRD